MIHQQFLKLCGSFVLQCYSGLFFDHSGIFLIHQPKKLALREASTFSAEDLSSIDSDATILNSLLGFGLSLVSFSSSLPSHSVMPAKKKRLCELTFIACQ